jgi:hypothetical protein
MATTIDRKAGTPEQQPRPAPRRRKGWAVRILAGAALVAVAVAAATFLWPSSDGQTPQQRAAVSLYTETEQKVMQLVNAGKVPAETLQGGVYRIKSLVNRGLIPAETLNEYRPPVKPLYTKRELLIMSLVASGQLPPETLNAEPFRTKRLINQGLIPREAAEPGSSAGR